MNKTSAEKRELGAYYTKSEVIVDYIITRLNLTSGLSILEPAVGDGEFIKGLERTGLDLQITAFDIDPVCVKHVKDKFPLIKIEEKNTLIENVTQFVDSTQKRWDRIVGNPPYGAEYDSNEKKMYAKIYPLINATESYALFLVNCINRLNEGGILSFVISDTFLHLNNHAKLRKFILDNCKIKEITLLKTKLFQTVNYQYAGLCIFTVQKCSNLKDRKSNLLRFINRIDKQEVLRKLSTTSFDAIPDYICGELIQQEKYEKFVDNIFFQAQIPNKLLELFMDHNDLVEDLVECKTGIYSGDNTRHFRILSTAKDMEKAVNAGYKTVDENEIIARSLTKIEKKDGVERQPYFVPLMKGGSGKYYKKPIWFIDWSSESLNYMLNNKKARVQNSEYYFRKGICMSLINSNTQQARIMEDVIFDQSDNGFFPKKEDQINFFLGFFNSKLFNYMLKKIINPTANATVNYVKKIPVIIPDTEYLTKINKAVQTIVNMKKNDENAQISEIEQELDNYFYEVYKLGKDEVRIIEEFCYHLR